MSTAPRIATVHDLTRGKCSAAKKGRNLWPLASDLSLMSGVVSQ
jgi:hypothetical protein